LWIKWQALVRCKQFSLNLIFQRAEKGVAWVQQSFVFSVRAPPAWQTPHSAHCTHPSLRRLCSMNTSRCTRFYLLILSSNQIWVLWIFKIQGLQPIPFNSIYYALKYSIITNCPFFLLICHDKQWKLALVPDVHVYFSCILHIITYSVMVKIASSIITHYLNIH
jgi:hypothetical protein